MITLAQKPRKRSLVIAIVIMLCLSASSGAAHAQTANCNQLLKYGIQDTLDERGTSKEAKSLRTTDDFFESTAETAWETLEKKVEESNQTNVSVDASFDYGLIAAQLGVDVATLKKMKKEDFQSKFQSKSSTWNKSSTRAEQESKAIATQKKTATVSKDLVDAFTKCALGTPNPGLYATAARDASDSVYLTVIWQPGAAASLTPAIPVRFESAFKGMTVKAKANEVVAQGSGRTFPVVCARKCDGPFQISVNGTISQGGTVRYSYSAVVNVPGRVKVTKAAACAGPPPAPLPDRMNTVGNQCRMSAARPCFAAYEGKWRCQVNGVVSLLDFGNGHNGYFQASNSGGQAGAGCMECDGTWTAAADNLSWVNVNGKLATTSDTSLEATWNWCGGGSVPACTTAGGTRASMTCTRVCTTAP